MRNGLLPLELRLKEFAEKNPANFPVHTANYWDRYTSLVQYLRTYIYPHINAGLACKSKSPGLYTDHGGSHFDEVVRYAGYILADKGDMEAYDLFLLLSAIRLHDAGNIDGREAHEKRVFAILKEAGNAVCSDDVEGTLIASIAEAHGGTRDGTNDKDTISVLPEEDGFGPIKCNPRSVAALVRFSDEICEHANRASAHHIKADSLPQENALFHLYANSIKRAAYEKQTKTFKMKLVFDSEYLGDKYQSPKHTEEKPDLVYLIDDALNRIEKLNTERLYCNRFLDPALRTEMVDVKVEIVQTEMVGNCPVRKLVDDWDFKLSECGYPGVDSSWRDNVSNLTGENVASELKQREEQG